MRISEVIRRKGTEVFTIAPSASVQQLVELLGKHRIGSLVVSEDDGETLVGIVSERDVMRGLSEQGTAIMQVSVANIMTAEVISCVPEDELEKLARVMTDRRIRHLPVVVEGHLEGLVSIGDIVKHRIDELQAERDHLADYVHG